MPGKLAAALKRFASRSVQLEQEVLKNPDFRLLCEDYGDAAEALERWSHSTDAMSPQRVLEYRRLVEELEKEIQNHLKTL
jgi:hypothetical protein